MRLSVADMKKVVALEDVLYVLEESYELADHVEAMKKYLKENELPDMTRRAFIADLNDVLKEVE